MTTDTPALEGPNPYAFALLIGLTRLGKHVYQGTVAAAEVQRRRKANRVARVSRRVNRSSK